MPPPPVRNDADCRKRMKSLAARLRKLKCPAHKIPFALLAEGKLLRAYVSFRVSQETHKVDQAAADLLGTLDATAAG